MIDKLKDIFNLFENSSLNHMKYEDKNFKIELNKSIGSGSLNFTEDKNIAKDKNNSTNIVSNSDNLIEVTSPMVGVFYSKTGEDSKALVKIGERVKKGDILCIIEAVKMFNEVTSPVDGIIESKLVEDETLVEYGQVLFIINENA